MGAFIPMASAGTLTIKSAGIVIGREVVSTTAGIMASEYVYEKTGNQALAMAANIAASMGTSMAINKELENPETFKKFIADETGAVGLKGGSKSNKAKYKPSPKHDPTAGWGSPDPIPDEGTGQKLLDTSYSSSKNKQLYNIYNGQLIKFQPDTVDGWHSYLVENPAKEVPTDVLRKMLNDSKITKKQYKNFVKNNKR